MPTEQQNPNNASFSSKDIRISIFSLESILGRAAVEGIIEDMERYGVPLVNDHTRYTIAQIRLAVEKIFGIEGCRLIMERLIKSLSSGR